MGSGRRRLVLEWTGTGPDRGGAGVLNSEKDGAGAVAVMTTAGLACRGRDRPGACRTNLSLDPFKGAMFFILLDVNGSSEMEQVIPTCYLSFRNPVEILEGSRQVRA